MLVACTTSPCYPACTTHDSVHIHSAILGALAARQAIRVDYGVAPTVTLQQRVTFVCYTIAQPREWLGVVSRTIAGLLGTPRKNKAFGF